MLLRFSGEAWDLIPSELSLQGRYVTDLPDLTDGHEEGWNVRSYKTGIKQLLAHASARDRHYRINCEIRLLYGKQGNTPLLFTNEGNPC